MNSNSQVCAIFPQPFSISAWSTQPQAKSSYLRNTLTTLRWSTGTTDIGRSEGKLSIGMCLHGRGQGA